MNDLLAMSTNQTLWWISLGAGLVVALVVLALLEALRRAVTDIERSVSDVWTMGKRLAQNTQTTHLLRDTKLRSYDVLAEVRPDGASGAAPEPRTAPAPSVEETRQPERRRRWKPS